MTKFTSLESLTVEQRERAQNIETKEDLLAFLKDEEIDITDEQLEAVSGGDDYVDAMNDVGVG